MTHKIFRLLAVRLALLACISIACSLSALAKTEHNGIQLSDECINSKPYQVTRMLVKARPEQVWQILTDYGNSTQVFQTFKKCQVVVDKGNTKVVHYEVRPSGVMATFQYELELREVPNKLVEWHRVGGDFKAVDGFCKLEPADCGHSTMITYAQHVNGGIFMPQGLIKRQAHIDLPPAMAALKEHAETTMRIATTRAARTNN